MHLDDHIRTFLERRGAPAGAAALELRPLRGGLEAAAVLEVTARVASGDAPSRERWVLKVLERGAAREAHVYEELAGTALRTLAPRRLAAHWLGEENCLLHLERVVPLRRWPWSDVELAATVLVAAARLHASVGADRLELPAWDYEAELAAAARRAVAAVAGLPRDARSRPLRRGLPALRRFVGELMAARAALLSWSPLPAGPVHGDLHPANVLLGRDGGKGRVVFLDWGRARRGSPLEDVASWLQSLGYWEVEGRRRHDTLLRRYLLARGLPSRLDAELRTMYWVAAASNVLAGAIAYHVERSEQGSERARAAGLRAAGDALRVVRRADAAWHAFTRGAATAGDGDRPSDRNLPAVPASGAR